MNSTVDVMCAHELALKSAQRSIAEGIALCLPHDVESAGYAKGLNTALQQILMSGFDAATLAAGRDRLHQAFNALLYRPSCADMENPDSRIMEFVDEATRGFTVLLRCIREVSGQSTDELIDQSPYFDRSALLELDKSTLERLRDCQQVVGSILAEIGNSLNERDHLIDSGQRGRNFAHIVGRLWPLNRKGLQHLKVRILTHSVLPHRHRAKNIHCEPSQPFRVGIEPNFNEPGLDFTDLVDSKRLYLNPITILSTALVGVGLDSTLKPLTQGLVKLLCRIRHDSIPPQDNKEIA